MKRNIAVIISYDGTDFSGWQRQKGQRSIQGCLEQALGDLHGHSIPLIGAGRTDSGVHATGQVANFKSPKDSVKDWQFRDALNARLPREIRILKSYQVSDSFHARKDARSRHYEYRIIEGNAGAAHMTRFAWLIKELPPLNILNDMAREICGVHDFSTFTASGDPSPSRIREIRYAVFQSRGPLILFRICANAFLWRMVRSLLGTMIDSARRGGKASAFRDILYSCNRESAGPTAPARGLFLNKVDYEPSRNLK